MVYMVKRQMTHDEIAGADFGAILEYHCIQHKIAIIKYSKSLIKRVSRLNFDNEDFEDIDEVYSQIVMNADSVASLCRRLSHAVALLRE